MRLSPCTKTTFMKNILFLLLLPCPAFAQQSTSADVAVSPFLTVYFNKLTLFDGNCTIRKSECDHVIIQDGNLLITGPNEKIADPAMRNNKYTGTTDKQFPYLTGDVFTYDLDQKKGTLKGHVSLKENGIDISLGSYAVVDFSSNKYTFKKLK